MDYTMYLDSTMDSAMGPVDISALDGIMGFFATYSVVVIILAIVSIIANWKIYSKAGQPGWACIVPIYANVVQFKIVGLNPWLLLLYLIPFANIVAAVVFAIMIPFRLAKSFGKSAGWGFGLWLLPFIFNLILAFDSSEYVGPNGQA